MEPQPSPSFQITAPLRGFRLSVEQVRRAWECLRRSEDDARKYKVRTAQDVLHELDEYANAFVLRGYPRPKLCFLSESDLRLVSLAMMVTRVPYRRVDTREPCWVLGMRVVVKETL